MRPKPSKGTSTYNPATITHYQRRLGEKIYEIHDHLGNIRTSFFDIKEPRNLALLKTDPNYNYKLHTLTAVNYFPYGSERDGQSYQAPEYNFGFNAMLRDDEFKGDGRSYSTLFREYDPLLGRWMSLDPKLSASESPYSAMGCNPIRFVDKNGDLPGDPFDSPDQAAHDFGKNYNPVSFVIDMEISTSFYEYQDKDGNKKYTYGLPNAFARTGSNFEISNIDKQGYIKVAEGHTHGPYEDNNPKRAEVKVNEDYFSKKDMTNKDFMQYLVTPGGFLKLFDPKTNETTTITKDMPRDRKNLLLKELENWIQVDLIEEKRPIPLFMNTDNGMLKVEDLRKQVEREKK